MAITRATLTSNGDTNGSGTPSTTASVTLTANKLELLTIVFNIFGGGTLPTGCTVTSTGATWVEVNHITATGGNTDAVWIFRTMVASNQTGAITITPSGDASKKATSWSLEEFDGVDTGGTNGSTAVVQSAAFQGETANPQVLPTSGLNPVLSALGDAVNNATFMGNSSGSAVSSTNLTNLVDSLFGGDYRIQTGWLLPGTTSPTITETTAFQPLAGVALEIKAASGGGGASLFMGKSIWMTA